MRAEGVACRAARDKRDLREECMQPMSNSQGHAKMGVKLNAREEADLLALFADSPRSPLRSKHLLALLELLQRDALEVDVHAHRHHHHLRSDTAKAEAAFSKLSSVSTKASGPKLQEARVKRP